MSDPLVFTTVGMIPRSELIVRETVTETDDVRATRITWHLGEQEVRSDVWVLPLRPLETRTNG